MADQQCCDTFIWIVKGCSIHTHVSILPQNSLPSRLPQNIGQSSMCYTISPRWLPVLNSSVCMSIQTFYLSFPLATISSFSKSVFTDNFENWKSWFRFLKARHTEGLVSWETLSSIKYISWIEVIFCDICINSMYIYSVIFFISSSIGRIYKVSCILGY